MKFNYKHLILFLCIVLVIFRLLVPPTNVLSWDVFGYYLYLPAKFIYHDLHLLNQTWLDGLINTYDPTSTLYQAVQVENGNWVMKYSLGLAILYTPFFFIAYLIAGPLGYPADGLSLPFQYSLAIGGLVYAIIGLIFLSKALRSYFNNTTTCLLLILITIGTNYFQLTVFDGTLLSHNFLFTLYAVLVYYTIRWHNEPKLKFAIGLGFLCGLITLIRPSEVVCIIIPVVWNLYNKESFNIKFELLKKNFVHILIFALCIILVFIPQIYYWKTTTGKYLFYSYTNPGEGFNFLSPYIISFLFSFRKGWFIYTPIMLFSLIGFYYLFKRNRNIFLPILIFIVADIYIISSWSCWYYAGGSYSSRSLVPAYVFLAFPLGYFIEKIKSSATVTKYLFIGIGLFLITLNLFQTWQFENRILSKDRMTRAYYFAIFGKTSVSKEDEKLLLVYRTPEPDEYFENENGYTQKVLYQNNFDENKNKKLLNDSSGVFLLDEKNNFSPGLKLPYHEITETDHAWIRASAKIFVPEGYDEEIPLLVVTFQHNGENYKYKSQEIKKDSVKYNSWNTISIDYLTPEVFSESDSLCVYIWYRGKQGILADEIRVDAFELNK
jgi:hypothetical protein